MSTEELKKARPKFHSPLPFIIKLRNLIFGTKQPGIYTQLTFFIHLIGLSLFSLWSVLSYFSITYRTVFLEQKGVDVAAIIELRGSELGFEEGEFLNRLATFHGISMICWGVVFFSLILLWREKRAFGYFFFGGTIFYFGMLIFYVGFDYYIYDTTRFDKILFLILILNSLFYVLFKKQNYREEDASFFD